jgi:hypothetical protein
VKGRAAALLAGFLLALSGLLATGTVSASPAEPMHDDELERLRHLYIQAVERSEAVAAGLEEVRRMRRSHPDSADSHSHLTFRAYEGALLTLRAKHGFWPPARLRHLREGLEILDDVIARDPAHAEARYLRLMSCYYLPGILGRGDSVREDFAVLARLLPEVRDQYPADLFDAIAGFVLKNGKPDEEAEGELKSSLYGSDG